MENLFINSGITAPTFILYVDTVNAHTITTIKSMLEQDFDMYYSIVVVYNNKMSYDLDEEQNKEYQDLIKNSIITIVDTNKIKPSNVSTIKDACAYDGALKKSNKYAFLVYNGDIVSKDRLAKQVALMRKTKCDVLLSSYVKDGETYSFNEGYEDDKYIISGACINIESFIDQDYIFEPYWEGSFFERFLLHCKLHNKKVETSDDPVTNVAWRTPEYESWVNNKHEQIRRLTHIEEQVDDQDITIIIPFKNEGAEIEKTVASIRATSKKFIKVILINDTSNDGIDYKHIAELYKCEYHENETNLGVAGSRDFAIFNLVKTKFFMILDGHMRFYDLDWDDILLPFVYEHPTDITCTATIEIVKDKEFTYNEDGVDRIPSTSGSYFDHYPSWHCEWLNKAIFDDRYYVFPDKKIMEVPIVLGACYSSTVEWWRKIGGLKFLKKYGNDEQLMSIKNYMYGGHNYYLKEFFTGHYYKIKPYQNTIKEFSAEITYNNLMMTSLFLPENIHDHFSQFKSHSQCDRICDMLNRESQNINKYREQLKKECKHTFADYMKFHNEFAYKTNGKKILCIGYDKTVSYYIKMGYDVTLYEADPKLCKDLSIKMHSDIENNLLKLVNELVVPNNKEYNQYYINDKDATKSSIFEAVANDRQKISLNVIPIYVKSTTLKNIIQKDNSYDMVRIHTNYDESNIIKSLRPTKKPKYIVMMSRPSLDSPKDENGNLNMFRTLDYLHSIGYNKFLLLSSIYVGEFGPTINMNKYTYVDYEECKHLLKYNIDKFLSANNSFSKYNDALHATY